MPRCVIGLDLATTTGWAVDDGVKPIAGTFRLPAKPKAPALDGEDERDQEAAHDAVRFAAFSQWLRSFLSTHRPVLVAIEAPLLASPTRTFQEDRVVDGRAVRVGVKKAAENPKTKLLSFGLRAIALQVCGSLGIPVTEVPIGTWRSAFFGKGESRAPKSAENGREWQKKRAKAQAAMLGVQLKSDDAAEALGIAFWARGKANVGTMKRPGQLL